MFFNYFCGVLLSTVAIKILKYVIKVQDMKSQSILLRLRAMINFCENLKYLIDYKFQRDDKVH